MRYFWFIFLGLINFCVHSQQYNFINFGVTDGLAQSQVTDICQDQLGNLWIGTQSGLSRFDSKTFVNYSIDDGLPDNTISHVFKSSNNDIWIVTPKGLSKHVNGGFISYFFKKTERISDIVELNGEIFLSSNQEIKSFNGKTFNTVFTATDSQLKIRSLAKTKDSSIICGTNKGAFELIDKEFKKVRLNGLSDLNISDLKIRGHQLIIATFNKGIIEYNLKADLFTRYEVQGTPIRKLFVDAVSIWASSDYGVIEIRNGKETYYTDRNGLSINTIIAIMKDMEGNLWIGTDGKGILKFSGNAIVSYSVKEGLNSDIVMSISQDSGGNFIFGTYDRGINFYSKKDEVYQVDDQTVLKHNAVWSIYTDFENISWIGTRVGIQAFSDQKPIKTKITDLIDSKIRSICQHKDSSIFFGGSEGLWMLRNDSIITILNDGVYDINKVVITDSTLFIATRNGLYWQDYRMLNDPFNKIELPEINTNTLCIDRFNNIWVGTINGLFIVSPILQVKSLELDKGNYQAKNIMGIIKDRMNRMWVSTTHGLYMLSNTDPFTTIPMYYQYGLSEGLVDMESNLNALFEDNKGRIWVGTSSALVRINPVLNPVLFSYNLPKLSITGVRLFKEKFDYLTYSKGDLMLTGVPKVLKLPYTKNHLTFDFIGVNNKNPDKVFYTYRLVGAEEKWSPITKENSASYSFIGPGVYEFQVKSANKNLEWTEHVSLQIVITPPFWKKWWFIILVGIAVAALSYFILNARISGIKQKKDNERLVSENKLKNLEQQSLNASMNRHFIFNSLNSIQYFINSSDKKSANRYLSNFAQLIRKNLDSSTQPNFLVSLNDEIERISLYLALEEMRFNGKFDYVINTEVEIDTEMIQVPSMILQPFVENSIIHGVLPKSEKGHISIDIKEENEYIVFEVNDDGVGIDSSLNDKGEFDGDHKSQGMEITANRIDLLRSINGDKLMIIGPFQINKNGKPIGTKVIIKLPIS